MSRLVAPQVLPGTGCLCFWRGGKLYPPIPLAEGPSAGLMYMTGHLRLNLQLLSYLGTCVLHVYAQKHVTHSVLCVVGVRRASKFPICVLWKVKATLAVWCAGTCHCQHHSFYLGVGFRNCCFHISLFTHTLTLSPHKQK